MSAKKTRPGEMRHRPVPVLILIFGCRHTRDMIKAMNPEQIDSAFDHAIRHVRTKGRQL